MAEVAAPGILELDYFGDFTLYQHPPCMFILWYLALGVNAFWDVFGDLIGGEGGEAPPPAPPPAEEEEG